MLFRSVVQNYLQILHQKMKTIFIATLCCISLACASVIINADDVDLDEEEYKRQFGTFNIVSNYVHFLRVVILI